MCGNNGGRSGAGHGHQRLGAYTTVGGDGSHRGAPLFRLQAHAILSSARFQNR